MDGLLAATLTLLGPPSSSEAITNSASLQTSAMLWPSGTSTAAHALKVAHRKLERAALASAGSAPFTHTGLNFQAHTLDNSS